MLILLLLLILLFAGGGFYGGPDYPYRTPGFTLAMILLVVLLLWGFGGPHWGWTPLW
jgi:hypothetical protein